MKKNKTKRIMVGIFLLLLLAALAFVGYEYVQRTIYMLDYEELILRYAAEYDLDPNLVAAVIHTESRFRPEAVSSAGAMGLMQIMPTVGEWIASDKLGDAAFTTNDLLKPEVNIRYGCWVLDYHLKRYDGDIALSLAAYNAGEGRVREWQKNPQYSQDGVHLDEIPFKETRNYITKVNNAYAQYKKLYDLHI
jgi:soluble lytic murein transglycosylase